MNRQLDIVIAGGGLAGLTAAALLAADGAHRPWRIRVFDAGRRPAFDPDSVALRVSALSPGSLAVFRALGVWDDIAARRSCPFSEMRVWDAARTWDGPEALHFDAAEFAAPELGRIVENALVQDALLAFLSRTGVEIDFEKCVADLRAGHDRTEVVFEDGQSIMADLLIGADGANSAVRRLSNIPVSAWRYPQSAFVTHLVPEKPHRNCAWQRFLPEGPLALLPLNDGRVSVVWSTRPAQAEAAMAASDRRLGELLTEASDRVLGGLTVAAPRAAFPLKAQFARSYVRSGLALIGDAAHSIHPLAGQGVNLGIADARLLAGVVSAAVAAGEHPGDWPVLRRFERPRKGANQTMLYFVDALNRLFASPSPPLAALRGAGMRLFNMSGPLRRRAVATALGVAADRAGDRYGPAATG